MSTDPLVIMLRRAEEAAPQRCGLARQLGNQSPERRSAIVSAIEGKAQSQTIVDALALFDIVTDHKQIERHRYRGCLSCGMPGRHGTFGAVRP